MSDAAGLRLLEHLDAFLAERGGEYLADGWVLAEEQLVAREDRDLAAQAREGLSEFHCDDGRTDHNQPRRRLAAGQRLGRGPERRVCEARDRRHRRAGTGSHQTAVERHDPLAAVA